MGSIYICEKILDGPANRTFDEELSGGLGLSGAGADHAGVGALVLRVNLGDVQPAHAFTVTHLHMKTSNVIPWESEADSTENTV